MRCRVGREHARDHLFAATSDLAIDPPAEPAADPLSAVLNSLGVKLEQAPESLLAGLRSLLTHPPAGQAMSEAMAEQQRAVAAQLGGPDAELRAGLIGALTVGAGRRAGNVAMSVRVSLLPLTG